MLAGLGLLFLLSNANIFNELNIATEYRSPQERLDFREAYERKYKHLAMWMLQAIFSMGVFGSGKCSPAQERELIRDMIEPVISDRAR